MKFQNRSEAGKQLAAKLEKYRKEKNAIVIGLPRGGVITAFEVASALHLSLDIIVTRKIGAPQQPELAIGALGQDGKLTLDNDLMERLGLIEADLEQIIIEERKELKRRLKLYRGNKKSLFLNDKIVILVDDGIATGATMFAAIDAARALNAKKIVIAVPVCPPDLLLKIELVADEVICLSVPERFFSIGQFYQKFDQTSDEQVMRLLKKSVA